MRPNPWLRANLVEFIEEILNEKFHFLCSEYLKLFQVAWNLVLKVSYLLMRKGKWSHEL